MSTQHQSNQMGAKVPWEPYKAATNCNNKEALTHKNSINESFLINNSKQNLVRYKIDTNLEAFNSNRPGYQFDEFDFKLIETNQCNLDDNLNELFIKSKVKTNDLSTSLAKDMIEKCPNDNYEPCANNKLPPSFVDARFYTDVHFLKLANQLKKSQFKQTNKFRLSQ